MYEHLKVAGIDLLFSMFSPCLVYLFIVYFILVIKIYIGAVLFIYFRILSNMTSLLIFLREEKRGMHMQSGSFGVSLA